MYLIGQSHSNKITTQHILERCLIAGDRLVTDTEVFQEILHRYSAIGRKEAIQPAFEMLEGVVDHVYTIDLDDVQKAKFILLELDSLSARDAIHFSVMQRYQIENIMSFDRGFDICEGITRIFVSSNWI